jgi:hypothetical protein
MVSVVTVVSVRGAGVVVVVVGSIIVVKTDSVLNTVMVPLLES